MLRMFEQTFCRSKLKIYCSEAAKVFQTDIQRNEQLSVLYREFDDLCFNEDKHQHYNAIDNVL